MSDQKTFSETVRRWIGDVAYAVFMWSIGQSAREEKARGDAQFERMWSALHDIDDWAHAYPLSVFPEPDFKRVRELLEAGGISLDSVSASNMRHVISGVIDIVDKVWND